MSSARREFNTWASQHRGKVSHATLREAWLKCLSLKVQRRRLQFFLQPYRCTWTNQATRGGVPHWHLGHDRKLRRRVRRRILKWTLWRYYKVRRVYRIWRGTARHPPPPRVRRKE